MKFILLMGSLQYGVRRRISKLLAVLILALTLAPAAQSQTVTIAALGDSLTQGYGLPDGDGLVPQLQRWLTAQNADVKLLNAGVSGDTTAGGLARTDWTLTPDVDALIVALGGNDILRGLEPAVARANLDAILAKARALNLPILLVGLEAPSNFGPDFKAGYDNLYPELAAQYGTLFFASFLGPLGENRDQAAVLRDLMQADAIHPNADGVAVIVKALGPKILELIARVE